jgi:hypothetical protein
MDHETGGSAKLSGLDNVLQKDVPCALFFIQIINSKVSFNYS